MQDSGILTIVIIIVVVILLGPFLAQLAWQWVVPDIFGGMVAANLLPAKITWWQAFKLAIFFWLTGISGSRSSSK